MELRLLGPRHSARLSRNTAAARTRTLSLDDIAARIDDSQLSRTMSDPLRRYHLACAGLASSEEARLDDVWGAGEAHWMSLASSAQLISVDNTSHNIQLDRPDVVLDKIHELLR